MTKPPSAALPAGFNVTDFWPRLRCTARTLSEEMARSLAAARRYDQLRARPAADPASSGRGRAARQVFTELYADPA